MSLRARVSVFVEKFAQHLCELHVEINRRIEACNASYKLCSNVHKRHVDFNVGDYVMVRIRTECCSSRHASKLQPRGAGPFKILKCIGSNAYVIGISPDLGYSSTFKVRDLIAFNYFFTPLNDAFASVTTLPNELEPDDTIILTVPPPPYLVHEDKIDAILDD